MNRRGLLAATGMAAAAALAGCSGDDTDEPTDPPSGTPTEEPTETPSDGSDGSLPEGSPSSPNERLRGLIAGNAEFALDLHGRLTAAGDADNVFVSPYSVSVALAMTYAGAGGDAEAAMRETLGFSPGEETHLAFAELQDRLDARTTADAGPGSEADEIEAFRLDVANALWGEAEYRFSEDYLGLIEQYYEGGFNEANFANDHEAERERINQWVSNATEGRIEELIPENGLSPQTVLVLTNAIYFLAGWRHAFDPGDTTDATFTALDGTESAVPMMEQSLRTEYADLPDTQVIELPYVGGEVSMVLIVPDEGAFEAIEAELSGPTLFGAFEALGAADGDLRMPRFEYDFDAELRDVLGELGMEAALGPGADFSNMVESGGGPGIDDVFHKAFVSVDEEGTEAAAATAVDMVESQPPESFDLTLDRPFLFCIRDRPTDAVLFFGRVTDAGAARG